MNIEMEGTELVIEYDDEESFDAGRLFENMIHKNIECKHRYFKIYVPLKEKKKEISPESDQPRFSVCSNANDEKVVIDHEQNLMWQHSGSKKELTYNEAKAYIDIINSEGFAGFNDWRLPTIDELKGLLEERRNKDRLYIDPIFDSKQKWCWASDKYLSGAWYVYFLSGQVFRLVGILYGDFYARAVRNMK